jgi:adenine phosphoribosyltransferase
MNVKQALSLIREIPDYPVPGVLFRDITPLLKDGQAFAVVCDALSDSEHSYTAVVGIEARGFILGSAVARSRSLGFVPLRKSGKLPFERIGRSYGLEYGEDQIEAHIDALSKDDSVLLVDDVLATGGTLVAGLELVHQLGAQVSEVVVLLEIESLGGRELIASKFPSIHIRSLMKV